MGKSDLSKTWGSVTAHCISRKQQKKTRMRAILLAFLVALMVSQALGQRGAEDYKATCSDSRGKFVSDNPSCGYIKDTGSPYGARCVKRCSGRKRRSIEVEERQRGAEDYKATCSDSRGKFVSDNPSCGYIKDTGSPYGARCVKR